MADSSTTSAASTVPSNMVVQSAGVPESKNDEPVLPTPPVDDDLIFGPSGFLGNRKGENLNKLITSIVEYAKYRLERLKNTSKSVETEIARLKSLITGYEVELTKLKAAGVTRGTGNASNEKEKALGSQINEMIDTRTRTADSIELIKTFIKKYCETAKADALKAELEEKITAAVKNLRKEVSGDSGTAILIRREIEKYLLNFTDSWQSFKNSYQLNLCLTGGAGVGKSTLARAAAKCFHAFGILASDIYKEPEPRDFIGEYIGQTTPKVFSILYGGLEGVVFIDEAYAIGQTPRFGQEFIDALVLFTQKFPGHISIIVAGYKKDMDEHFFKKNEGLNRRFPNQFELLPYPFSTINKAMISIVRSKMEIEDNEANFNMVKNTLKFHSFLASLAYLDTSDISSDDAGTLFNNQLTRYFPDTGSDYFTKLHFNLEPLIRILYLTNNIQKRDVMKAFILKYKFGIQTADLFPNQMGDVQNLVSEILKQENVIRGGAVTFMDAVAAMNSYFKIRDPHRFQIVKVSEPTLETGTIISGGAASSSSATPTMTPAPERYMIHFCPHAQSPSTFEANVLRPLFSPLFKKDNASFDFFADISEPDDIKRISTYVDKLYTTAIQQLSADFEAQSKPESNVIKLPGSIRYAFVKQQMDLLNFEIKSRQERTGTVVGEPVLLSYFDAKSSDDSDVFEIGAPSSLTIPQGKPLDEICAGVDLSATVAPVIPTTPKINLNKLLKPAKQPTALVGGGAAGSSTIPVFEATEAFDKVDGSFITINSSTKYNVLFEKYSEDKDQTLYYIINGKDVVPPPDTFIIKNATSTGTCDVKLTKIDKETWKATQTDGTNLTRTKLKQSQLTFDSEGKVALQASHPFTFHSNYDDATTINFRVLPTEFDTEYVTLSCSNTSASASSSGGSSASSASSAESTPSVEALPVFQAKEQYLANYDNKITIEFYKDEATKETDSFRFFPSFHETLNSYKWEEGEGVDPPESFLVKNATMNGDCEILMKKTMNKRTLWQAFTKEGGPLYRTKIATAPVDRVEVNPFTYYVKINKPSDVPPEFYTLSCTNPPNTLGSSDDAAVGGGASATNPASKERRFGMKTRRGRKQRRGTTRKV